MRYYKKETLIYIEPYYDEKFNKAIDENYDLIANLFNQAKIPFVYLPKLLKDVHINKVLEYNYPYLKELHHTNPDKLYQLISNSFRLKLDGPAFVYISDDGKSTFQFDIPSSEKLTSPEQLNVFVEEIKNKIHPVEYDTSDIRFRNATHSLKEEFFSESLSNEERENFQYFDKVYESESAHTLKDAAEDLFEKKAFKISDDLQLKIEELREAGHLSHLIKYLEILQEVTRKLSRLKITEDYRIYLIDYEMKEVKMSPLPKALYILLLNHPEGISFKELTDYRKELMNIYKNISLRENHLKAIFSIKKLTNPLDNSVHEKCSRIREAFLKVVAEDIAENYYITGARGEPKKVLLDRELVLYDK